MTSSAIKLYNSKISGRKAGQPLASAVRQFQKELQGWYERAGRHDLPWRHTDSAYAILVSEMMLQQTQVETVLQRFYHPFLKRFPTLSSLANASLQEVMEEWQGLGYYRRAKFLHQAAQRSAPKLPSDFDGLIALPGIGKNTAHAVLALAYRKPYPVMEANVKRVLCRIFAMETANEKQLWEHAFSLLDKGNPFDYNQAMMDLGAMICKPKAPKCERCPASNICQGKGAPERYPTPKAKKKIPIRKQQIVAIEDLQGRIYMTPRDGEFLHGLFQFVEIDAGSDAMQLNDELYSKQNWQYIGEVEQTYSHFKQQAEVYRLSYKGQHRPSHWYLPVDIKKLPLSKKEQKILALIKV